MPEFTAPGLDTGYGDEVAPTRVDPDLDALTAPAASDLDDLRAELAGDPDVSPTTVIENLGRTRYSVRFRTDFTGKELDRLRSKCKDKSMVDKFDGVKFAALLLAAMALEVLRDGQPIGPALDVDGPVTFTTRELQELYGTSSADATVRKFYAREGFATAAANRLMDEAGWGDEAYAVDPTQ